MAPARQPALAGARFSYTRRVNFQCAATIWTPRAVRLSCTTASHSVRALAPSNCAASVRLPTGSRARAVAREDGEKSQVSVPLLGATRLHGIQAIQCHDQGLCIQGGEDL